MVSRDPEQAGETRTNRIPGLATLHVVPGMPMLRPAETVFEKVIEGYTDHQRARNLQRDTVSGRVKTVRQVRAFADAYPWEPAWNRTLFDRWSAMLADQMAASTMSMRQLQLKNFLEYFTDTAYEWPRVCLELFGTFPSQVLRELNHVRHSQEYMGQPSRNRPLSRDEVRRFFGQIDPEIKRLRAVGHKGALTAARDLAMFTTIYGWGLRRREAALLEVHDWRRQAKLREFGDHAGLAVRYGKAKAGQPPRRRMVVSVWPWAVGTVRYYLEHVRPLFYEHRDDDGAMFPTERGEVISIRSVNDRFAHWRTMAGLPQALCVHCLRHILPA
ncbi:tyrosine-type recombinase/integrase [Streptosporangium canum]|uniref:tyrosine-type recombinase/integrase n=1 Tax=Streptosporangium canum TaxID=324952 RepID=UPI003688DC85